ncbi:MAG: hypothetical protein QNJ29_05625 [Rhizobiaceae bacterium]|nr:hypothetical protein [Rhizobiaceae bacterium]
MRTRFVTLPLIFALAACTSTDVGGLKLEQSTTSSPAYSAYLEPLVTDCIVAIDSGTLNPDEILERGFEPHQTGFRKTVQSGSANPSPDTIAISYNKDQADCVIATSLNLGTQSELFVSLNRQLTNTGYVKANEVRSLFGSTIFDFKKGSQTVRATAHIPEQNAPRNRVTLVSLTKIG